MKSALFSMLLAIGVAISLSGCIIDPGYHHGGGYYHEGGPGPGPAPGYHPGPAPGPGGYHNGY